MKTAGVVLDFYDDLQGELLKRSFPSPEVLPEVVKTAHILSSEERDILRDEAFALVLMNEGKVLRKFACVDAGNTLLSALYFMENKDALPEEAQKIASANITAACEEFGLPLRDIEKIASGGSQVSPAKGTAKGAARSRDPMHQPIVGDEANWAERTNLVSVRGGADAGRVIPLANQIKTAEKVDYLKDFHKLNPEADPRKGALTDDKKFTDVTKKNPAKQNKKPVIPDTNSFAVGPGKGDAEVNYKPVTWNKVANRVDVSDLEPSVKVKKASPIHAALGLYPLDNFADVQKAVQYFDENYLEFVPRQRHEYAMKTAARAEELGIQTSEILDRYGSTEYAPDVEAHLANRRAVAPDHKELWDELQEKRASIEPETFAELLAEADEVSGVKWLYGGEAADPYFATFGGNKVKEANVAWNWQSRTGDYVSAGQLKKLALNGRPLVEKQFDRTLAAEFSRNPITIFESLPDLQKTILARLANQEFDGLPNN